ncbi:MAG: hypothetical protein KGI08_09660 [Thaumarchaeota archaeon]|nr:hypothetical protein [Nitrososphaerota archaeon]
MSRITSGPSGSFNSGYAVGDLIVILAFNNAATTIPSTPSGYTQLTSATNSSSGSTAMAVFWKVATSTSETYPSITNATQSVYVIYRAQQATPFVQTGGQTSVGASSTITYSGIATFQNPGYDLVLAFSCCNASSAATGSNPPTNMSLVPGTEISGAGYDIAIFDTNAPVSSYSLNNKTLGASVAWMTKTAELQATPNTEHNNFSEYRKSIQVGNGMGRSEIAN